MPGGLLSLVGFNPTEDAHRAQQEADDQRQQVNQQLGYQAKLQAAQQFQDQQDQRQKQSDWGYLGAMGAHAAGLNAPAYTSPTSLNLDSSIPPGSGQALSPQTENPYDKKQVQDWESMVDQIKQEPSLDDHRRSLLLNDLNGKMDALDPQQRYRRSSSVMTPIDKFMAGNVKMMPEQGLAVALDAKGMPHFHNLPGKEEEVPTTPEGMLAHFRANTIRDPETGNLFTHNKKAGKWELLHERQPVEDKQKAQDDKEESEEEKRLDANHQRQLSSEAAHVQKIMGDLLKEDVGDEDKEGKPVMQGTQQRQRKRTETEIKREAFKVLRPELIAQHHDFDQEAIDRREADWQQTKRQHMANWRTRRDARRNGDYSMPLPKTPKSAAPVSESKTLSDLTGLTESDYSGSFSKPAPKQPASFLPGLP